jgi:hypothetical protein
LAGRRAHCGHRQPAPHASHAAGFVINPAVADLNKQPVSDGLKGAQRHRFLFGG